MDSVVTLKDNIAKAIQNAWNGNGNAKKDVITAIIKDVYEKHTAIIQGGQTPIQTRYGALYYETPYRGESTCSSCDGSCVYIRGTKHELPCPDDHNGQTK